MARQPAFIEQQALQLSEITNTPLRQRIADIIREAILNGELKPGQPLVEMNLASQLGVSRAPVREALRTLSKDGLVDSVPYRGTTVRKLTRKDIEELYSLRGVHETFAIRRIIELGKQERLEPLQAICEKMQRLAETDDMKQVSAEDENFHRTIIALADHELLTSIWSTLSMRVRQIMSLRNQQNRNPMEVALNHPPIVEAIAESDIEKATALIDKHVASAADLIIEEWIYN